jgi:hypothetical protein
VELLAKALRSRTEDETDEDREEDRETELIADPIERIARFSTTTRCYNINISNNILLNKINKPLEDVSLAGYYHHETM